MGPAQIPIRLNRAQLPVPHHRHQVSLENVIDTNPTSRLSQPESVQAFTIFQQIIDGYQRRNPTPQPPTSTTYCRAGLAKYFHQYAITEEGKEKFLKWFLTAVSPVWSGDDDQVRPSFDAVLDSLKDFASWHEEEGPRAHVFSQLQDFSEEIVSNLFLPLRAIGSQTPQPTPTVSAPATIPPSGVTGRLGNLRGKCLIRDHHRCVISRQFDVAEAERRLVLDPNAEDDDGNLLRLEADVPHFLEVAHIIPHTIMSYDAKSGDSELTQSKKHTLAILDMFDPGLLHIIDGQQIETPRNAMSLSHDLHKKFGALQIYFEADTASATDYSYTIHRIHNFPFDDPKFPLHRHLLPSSDHTIDPPSARLLAVHRACALILHMSGTGAYIERILRDLEDIEVEADGTTDIASLVGLRLGGFWDGRMKVY